MALYLQRCLSLHYMTQRNQLFAMTGEVVSTVAMCRNKSHGNLPTKRLKNPWVQRNTDFIKLLCIALVKYERIQTTHRRAVQLQQYGNLLVELTRRTQPPPDITIVIENGFLLRPDEIKEKFKAKKMVNRRWKNRILYPEPLSDNEFIARCHETASCILLQDSHAIDKLYGELRERYLDTQAKNFVNITKIPNAKRRKYPDLAYVELRGNNLPPLPSSLIREKGKEKLEDNALSN